MKLAANGNIAPWQEAIVGAEGRAAHQRSAVNVGDIVKRGQGARHLRAGRSRRPGAQQNAAVAEAEAALVEADANAARPHPAGQRRDVRAADQSVRRQPKRQPRACRRPRRRATTASYASATPASCPG